MPSVGWQCLVITAVAVPLAACNNSPANVTKQPDPQRAEAAATDEKQPAPQPAVSPEPQAAEPPSFFPTAVGTRWKWESSTTIGDGKGPLAPTVLTSELQSRLAGHEEINGVKCARIEVTDSLGTVVQTEYMSVTPEGLFRHGMNQDRFDPPIKVLALPAKVGTTWKAKYTVQGIAVETSSKIAAQEAVTVPAGRFDTVRVEVEHSLLTTTTWYAPGVGVVKQLVDKPILSQKDELELQEFSSPDSNSAIEP